MFVLIINMNSTIFQAKYSALFFPLATNMPHARETEPRTPISAGKLKQGKEKNIIIYFLEQDGHPRPRILFSCRTLSSLIFL